MIIQEIAFGSDPYEETKRFRDEVLRRPLGLSLSVHDLLGEKEQTHIAAVAANGTIVGTVLLKPVAGLVIKLRQMAVAPDLRRRGIGAELVRYAEAAAVVRGFQIMEMHARVSAEGFYKKLGYRSIGAEFIEVTVPTIKMVKRIP